MTIAPLALAAAREVLWRWLLLAGLAEVGAGCTPPNATSQSTGTPDSTTEARATPPSSIAHDQQPTPSTRTPPAPGSATRLATGVDPRRDACKIDADCQLTPGCACDSCIATKKMHVELCPKPCDVDGCAGQRPVCAAGASTSDRPPPNAPSAAVMAEASRAGQLVLDDPRFVAYLHAPERPQRLPLVVAWEPGVPHPTWTAAGVPARIVEGLPGGDALIPTLVLVDGDVATFRFEYPPEGIEVSAELVRKGDVWTIKGLAITER
jgi:hypothetical protein